MANERARDMRKTMSDGERKLWYALRDGGHHTEEAQVDHDRRRDRWLSAEGFRVIRVPNTEVLSNISGVVDTIWAVLQEMPSRRTEGHPDQARRMS